jgi:N-acetylmuramate 1-kinase
LQRRQTLEQWVASLYPGVALEIAPASSDASFRRYFRVRGAGDSFIVMDAPPEQGSCAPFIHIAEIFRRAGVNVPRILHRDLDNGFLAVSDLGPHTYRQILTADNADFLYRRAFAALSEIQLASAPGILPDYSDSLLLLELRYFREWYVTTHLQVGLTAAQNTTLEELFALLIANHLAQPPVYVHRDYHSRNLMVCEPMPGILDFQDALYGPITYDAVSLLKDAYAEWAEERVLDWLIRYWEMAKRSGLPVGRDFAAFHRDFEWMGVQRHLKVLGIFARLYHRDGKDRYLKDLPLVMRYLRRACERYRELTPLLHLLDMLERTSKAPVLTAG